MLAGCSGSQPPVSAPGTMPQTSAFATHAARGKSWMLPEAKHDDLLYASVQTSCCAKYSADVFVFSYPSGKPVGELGVTADTMFGLCSDEQGDVFVTGFNTYTTGGSSYVYEYRHGGTKPIAKLLDPLAADACSVDPVTGNLAVAGWTGNQAASLVIYSQTGGKYTGSYTPYYDSAIRWVRWCAYDTSGNLYLDGENGSGLVRLAVLHDGEFSAIDLNRSDFAPYSLQWADDGDLVIAGYEGTIGPETLLEVQMDGTKATIVGTTILKDAGHKWGDDSQISIKGLRIVGGGYPGDHLMAWRLHKGGHPDQRIAQTPDGWWYGVAFSLHRGRNGQ
ncbi:MAG: hypothetical protein WAK11_10560 [Candidatus Cybelea sp.]